MRDFQRSLRANADRLLHARDLVEAVVQTIGQSLGCRDRAGHTATAAGPGDRQVGEGDSRWRSTGAARSSLMSLNAVLSNALSGLAVAQNALSRDLQQRRQRQHRGLLAAAAQQEA